MADPPIDKHIKVLEKRISSVGFFTLTDAASITGIAIEDARKALDVLMTKYRTKLQLTDEGTLIYNFGKNPRRRGSKTFGERWDAFKEKLWSTFKFLFKIWIAATLVIYFFIFLVILIALLLALISGNKNRKSKGGGRAVGQMIEMVTRMFFHIFRWNTHSGNIIQERDRKGYPYPEYDPYDTEFDKVTKPRKKSIVGSIYDFVFGPPRVPVQDLANQKEAAAYLRRKNGIIVLPEMKALAGWDSEQANHFFTDCVVRFDGEAKVSENGILYGKFSDLLKSIDKKTDATVEWFWDEYEPEYKLTGNSKARDLIIVAMSGLNLFGSLWVLNFLSSAELEIDLPTGAGAEFFLGWFPLFFTCIFLAVPFLRFFKTRKAEKARETRNVRKRLMDTVYNNKVNVISNEQLMKAANRRSEGEDDLSAKEVEKIMTDFIEDWDGEVEATEEGEVVYRFPRLKEELEEAERLRSLNLDSGDMGQIIVSTES